MNSDLRTGLRLLWKNRAFTATAALTLAMCIGANTALFSVVHNVLLRPLPVPESERLMLMGNSYPKAGAEGLGTSGVPDYYDRLRETNVYDEQTAFNTRSQTIDQNGTPARIRVMRATPSFFRLVRVAPALGRAFSDAEGEIGNERKAVLSYALWQSAFGGDPAIVGKDIRLDGQPHAVVGVMPREFVFVEPDVMLWVPAAFTAEQKSDAQRHSNNWRNVGRLKPGATREQAQQQIDALNAANLKRFPQYAELLTNAGFHSVVIPLQDFLVRDVKPILYLMWGGALFVLLIGVVNVANLVLVRSRARVKELATRLALGAGRARVARQLVVESVLLTMLSAIGGLVLGSVTLRLLGTLNIQDLPRGQEIRIDGVVVTAVLLASAIGFVLGLIPVASVVPANLTSVLREEGRSSSAGRGARTLRRALVVAQVGFAFMLLVGAGLLFASFRRVLAVDPGFKTEGVLTASVTLPRTRYGEQPSLVGFRSAVLRQVRALPGVTAAGATDWLPMSDSSNDSVIIAEGYQMKPGESVISPASVEVSPGYFEAIGARLARGRFFDERDSTDGPKTIIVDERLARRFWPNQDPLGRRLYFPSDINNLLAVTKDTRFMTVVGVVHDLKLHNLTEGEKAVGAYFVPMDQADSRAMSFAVKTSTDPTSLASALRSTVAQLDRELPLFDVQTMELRMEKALMTRRSPVLLSLGFGAVALVLSAVGIYGVLAYLVTQRTREIGIRIALGSSGRAIVELVLREGLLLVGGGFVAGAVGASLLHKTLESQLFGIRAGDPVVLTAVTALLAAVALVACALPARRATKVDPIVALTE